VKLSFTHRARDQVASLSASKQARLEKQLAFLLRDLRHPSLRAKKHDESRGIWQARVDRDYRFYFLIEEDTYLVLSVIPHPK
jgi:mRNA interferase RelE/StbE